MVIIKFSKDSAKGKPQSLQEVKKKQNIENRKKLVNQRVVNKLVVIQISRPVVIENMSQLEITTNGPAKGFRSKIIHIHFVP